MTKDSTTSGTVEEVATKALDNTQDPVATFAMLKAKPKRTTTFPVTLQDEDGEEVTVTMTLQSIGQVAYNKLVEEHPPTREQQQRGQVFNIDTFAPALVAACSLRPKLTVEQTTELQDDENWSGGEFGDLYGRCMAICNAGLDIPFNARG